MQTGRTLHPQRFFMGRLPAVFLGLSLILTSACTTASTAQQTPPFPRCENAPGSMQNLPTNVIAGTDIVDVGSFDESDIPAIGEYTGETGGALITVSITAEAIIRTFGEPGTRPLRRTFLSPCTSGPYLVAEGALAQLTPDGLLYLEPSSVTGGLPDDLWIFLNSQ